MPAPSAHRPCVVGSGNDVRANRQGDESGSVVGCQLVEKEGLERDVVLRGRLRFNRLFFGLLLTVD